MQDRLQRELKELRQLRAATITHLRAAFETQGYDVTSYPDDVLSRAILDEALAGGSIRELFSRAYERLTK